MTNRKHAECFKVKTGTLEDDKEPHDSNFYVFSVFLALKPKTNEHKTVERESIVQI